MTSASNVSYTFEDLGAVLHKARLRASETMSAQDDAWRRLTRGARHQLANSADGLTRNQILAAPDFFYSHLRSAVFSAACYFEYSTVFEKLSAKTVPDPVRDAAIEAAHVFADVVPIDLFNAMNTASSVEMVLIAPEWGKKSKECFAEIFPHVKEARDAVTHAHDRQFGRYVNKLLPNAEVGGGPLAHCGKRYTDDRGGKFIFAFDLYRFERLLQSFASLV
jgi:hypothetical protein